MGPSAPERASCRRAGTGAPGYARGIGAQPPLYRGRHRRIPVRGEAEPAADPGRGAAFPGLPGHPCRAAFRPRSCAHLRIETSPGGTPGRRPGPCPHRQGTADRRRRPDRGAVRREAGRAQRDGGAALQPGPGGRRRHRCRPARPRTVLRGAGDRPHHGAPLRVPQGPADRLWPAGCVSSQNGVGAGGRGDAAGEPQGGKLHIGGEHGVRIDRCGNFLVDDVLPGVPLREDRVRIRSEKRRLHRPGTHPRRRCRVSRETAVVLRDQRDQPQPGQPDRFFGYAGACETRDRRTRPIRQIRLPGHKKGDVMQRPAHRFRLSILAVFAFIAACITVNIYFPAAKVEKTAEKIVDEVYQEKKVPAPADQKEKPQSLNDGGVSDVVVRLARLGPAPAWAEEATTVSNASIRALKDQIGGRHQELLPFYQQGKVGITKDGFLEVRGTEGLALPQVATLKRLVDADNAARRQLYEEVAKALNLKPEQVPQVRQIFAKQWRDKAQSGWWVQADSGQWTRK
ncbi:MAG: hypothetical protein C3F14_09175 [Deltaproteobacteria bacterium]|nr:MAG: hypothetical protein C3F14_09175 [Deltaproteobacteria bacterium]